MKKTLKILLILICAITLCSCKKKTEEQFLVEVTSDEFNTNFNKEEQTYFLAISNPKMSNNKEFLECLNTIANDNKTNIYYYDITPGLNDSILFLSSEVDIDVTANTFLVLDKGSITALAAYSSCEETKEILKDIKPTDDYTLTSNEEKENNYKKAKEYLEEGKISSSLVAIKNSWILKNTKDLYNKENIYTILDTWQSKERIDKNNYQEIFFSTYQDIMVTSKYKDFKKEAKSQKTEYYKIKDDIIYTSEKEDGDYIETYEITKLDKENLFLKDLKTEKTIEYKRRD